MSLYPPVCFLPFQSLPFMFFLINRPNHEDTIVSEVPHTVEALLETVKALVKVFIQDSVICKEIWPHLQIYSNDRVRAMFEHNEYISFAERVRARVQARKERYFLISHACIPKDLSYLLKNNRFLSIYAIILQNTQEICE